MSQLVELFPTAAGRDIKALAKLALSSPMLESEPASESSHKVPSAKMAREMNDSWPALSGSSETAMALPAGVAIWSSMNVHALKNPRHPFDSARHFKLVPPRPHRPHRSRMKSPPMSNAAAKSGPTRCELTHTISHDFGNYSSCLLTA